MKTKEEIISDLAQTVFLVFGGLCLFFSGHLVTEDLLLSFILLMIGTLSVMIRIEYTKDEVVKEGVSEH